MGARLQDEFVDPVPARMEKVTIPADVTSEGVQTSITDYSAKQQGTVEVERITVASRKFQTRPRCDSSCSRRQSCASCTM